MGSAVSLFCTFGFFDHVFPDDMESDQEFHFESAWMVVVALAALVAALKIRTYSPGSRTGIIRLEERLRLAALLPESSREKSQCSTKAN